MDNLAEQVQRSLLPPGPVRRDDKLLAAVSGGVDSMVLLDVLARAAKANRWKLSVAHLNHCLRGASSDADERLVELTAKRLKLPFFNEHVDVRRLAQTEGVSIEMAARKARHKFLSETAARKRIRFVALAHHADDQVELFFLRLLRGAGPQGLSGMKLASPSPANSKIVLVRPLLATPKSVLRAYAEEHKVPFREDPSNAQIDFRRNRIRSELLPLLRKHYQPALDRTVGRIMDILQAEGDLITEMAREWITANRSPFEQLPVALQRRCLYLQLLELDLEPDFALVEQLRLNQDRPCCVETDSASELSRTLRVARNLAGQVFLSEAEVPSFKQLSQTFDIQSSAGEAEFAGLRLQWRFQRSRSGVVVPRAGRELFDAEKVGDSITLRHWQPGDKFQPIGMSSAIKLQDLFVNAKISRPTRHELVVATCNRGEIFWVEGLRMGERFKLQKSTKRALQWRWQRR